MLRLTNRGGLLLWAIVLIISVACKSAPPRQNQQPSPSPATATGPYPNLTARANQLVDALARKDYGTMIDLTYPKLIEFAGGRDKMLAETTNEVQSMEAEGVQIVSSTCEPPTQFVTDATGIYAVVPIKSKIKAQEGLFQTEGSLIGISTDGGKTWTFVDAAGKDEKELKQVLPNLDQLHLPPQQPPVKLSTN